MFDVSLYLDRIGYQGPVRPDLPCLEGLVRSHLEAIPFENLTALTQVPDLSVDTLFDKIIRHRRGGYCFELNRLFYTLLTELGFTVYPVAVRTRYRLPQPRPWGHRASVVILNGQKWFCDVGYGGNGPKGLLSLDETGLQCIMGETFSIRMTDDSETVICRLDPDGMQDQFSFYDVPASEEDFEKMNHRIAADPVNPFSNEPILFLSTPQGLLGYRKGILTETVNGSSSQRPISPEEYPHMLWEVFGIELPADV